MDLGLNGKVAVVAGSSSGLGLATAEVLIAEGARVVISGRDQGRLDAALEHLNSANAAACLVDVLDADAGATLVGFARERFGRIDHLVTNAGGPPGGTFATTDLDAWQRGLDLTLMSAVRLIQAALPELRHSLTPSILTITSMSVKQPISGLLLSNVIRPAVVGLTKSLALELGRDGIRVNSILPGWTRTERVDYILETRARNNNTSVEHELNAITAGIALGRMAEPAEFGRVAAFLLSPAASYVTGEMFLVDGGFYRGLM